MVATVINTGSHLGGYKKSSCTHPYAKPVMQMGKKCKLWAGSRNELLDEGQWDLVVSAVGYADFLKNPITANEVAKTLLPDGLFKWSPPPCIGIDWPDREVPNLGADWWEQLAAAMKVIDGRVAVCCMGGHGRTGTMLAILAVLTGKVRKNKCPVAWVRKKYCQEAVESDEQVEYIEWVTDRKVTSICSDDSWFVGKAGAGSGSPVANPTETVLAPFPTKTATPGLTAVGSKAGEPLMGMGDGTRAVYDEPSDEELELALAKGDGHVTALIDGLGDQRWSPVYGEDDKEIVGWYEEHGLSKLYD